MNRGRSRSRPKRPIVIRLVLAVAVTMVLVLVLSSAFIYWRVAYALSRQVDQDLQAYREVVERALETGAVPVNDTPGETYQTYTLHGQIIGGTAKTRLADADTIRKAAAGHPQQDDSGHVLPPSRHPYRVVTSTVRTPAGKVVAAYAISRTKHDEALRELLLQLVIADLFTLLASTGVGFWTARSALGPVERYRRAAAAAVSDADATLPVPEGDDELTRLGHTFNDLLARLAAVNARERQFLADASHELRSPLTVMRSELEWTLLRPRPQEQTHEALESIQAQVLRLIDICNALLELEELRATSQPGTERVDLSELAQDTIDRAASTPEAAGRALELDAPDPVTVLGRSRWLELAVGNLLTNSLRHGAGQVRISVSADPAHAVLIVRDEGPGFPPEFIDNAFDRFSRADVSRTTRGTGLGLSLVQAVVEAHHGTAAIRGSSVVLRIPLAPPAPPEPEDDLSP
ncbi:sensor histidine kinase [Nocardioides terrisoli]|uniref:sensor histidine kinase n=1 Tax=Nocardioides terrisoli TaxID=3388267 RepID=UPI00287BB097|nr:HAMP domain-containing sensor histidine kinase [Nocardioides marmorisolisilvae]